MKLLTKFTLLFVLVFGTGLAIAGWFCYRFLQENARDQVLQQARLMMQAALSTRIYTVQQIRPLLDTPALRKVRFYPQTVPAYAATENFTSLRQQYPDYTYKEAALNPTNLRDRAVDWEADIINNFRNHRDQKELFNERDTPNGRSLFLARPIQAPQPCLECHSTPKAAPPEMIKIYGKANGFGWQPDEIIGAQIVSVPMRVPLGIAQQASTNLLLYLGTVALITLICLDLALVFLIVRPVSRLSSMADRISKGDMDVAELPVHGKDEISVLAGSFNRMYVSLMKAIRMLET